jgi:hypothetical protein
MQIFVQRVASEQTGVSVQFEILTASKLVSEAYVKQISA